jgi:RimJ/RimL family protein N-acetyltransferase
MDGTEPRRAALLDPTAATLTDGVIQIRPLAEQDAHALFEAISESLPQLCTWLTWCRPNYNIRDCFAYVLKAQADWQKGQQFNFGTFDVKTQALRGSVALNQITAAHQFANIGYWVRSSNAGQGIATASVKLIAKFAFQTLGLNRLEIVVPVGNVPSQRTALKAGAFFEGTLRQRLLLTGKLHDANLYSLPSDTRSGRSVNLTVGRGSWGHADNMRLTLHAAPQSQPTVSQLAQRILGQDQQLPVDRSSPCHTG